MQKFTKIEESKKFMPDPSILKTYASFIIPLYITGQLKCEEKFVDEWLEMHKPSKKFNNINQVCDLDILAIKNIFDNPTTITGFNQLKQDVENKCIKLQNFLKSYIQKVEFK